MNQCFSKVFVINLDEDTEKLEKITERMQKNHIQWERFPAINGRKVVREFEKKTPNRVQVTNLCRHFCTAATIGIYLSHREIWRRIVINGLENALILEDDVFFTEDCNEKIKEYWKQIPKNWDVVYLGCLGACYPSIREHNFFEYLTHYLGSVKDAGKRVSENVFVPFYPHGLHGYAISNKGAQKLLKLFDKASFHLDMQIPFYGTDLNIYAVHPNLVYQQIHTNQSSTAENRPYLLNQILNRFDYDSKGLPMSWRMSIPFGQILGYPLNVWPIFYILMAYLSRFFPWLRWLLLGSVLSDLIIALRKKQFHQIKYIGMDLFLVYLFL